ncbi:MAG: dihydropteroate synthase [Rhodocyclaceae bacterium]|nr:dihydropteroate synthase [Rhodocyclaceae bacterium]
MTKFLQCGRYTLDLGRPLVMGIVNLTDDSVSGDGLGSNVDQAIDHGLRLLKEGADILDIGAESSRPGAHAVPVDMEIQRLLPVIRKLMDCGIPISIDTTKPTVMRAVVDAGVDMINDINALRAKGALEIVATSKVAVCLMHMQGSPATMQAAPQYVDVVADVRSFLMERTAAANAAGILRDRIVIDPGFGFGKTLDHNLALLRHLRDLEPLGLPVLVGMSRKSMLGSLTGRDSGERMSAGIAAHLLAVQRGARIVRTHDVAATVDALTLVNAVERSDGNLH